MTRVHIMTAMLLAMVLRMSAAEPPAVPAHVLGQRDSHERRSRGQRGASEAGQRVAAEQI